MSTAADWPCYSGAGSLEEIGFMRRSVWPCFAASVQPKHPALLGHIFERIRAVVLEMVRYSASEATGRVPALGRTLDDRPGPHPQPHQENTEFVYPWLDSNVYPLMRALAEFSAPCATWTALWWTHHPGMAGRMQFHMNKTLN